MRGKMRRKGKFFFEKRKKCKKKSLRDDEHDVAYPHCWCVHSAELEHSCCHEGSEHRDGCAHLVEKVVEGGECSYFYLQALFRIYISNNIYCVRENFTLTR